MTRLIRVQFFDRRTQKLFMVLHETLKLSRLNTRHYLQIVKIGHKLLA